MKEAIDASVVIGFKDWGLERLVLSVTSIQQSFGELLAGEVIVSDYGSADPQAIRDAVDPLGARYIRTETAGEWSRSRALNAGIRSASGRHVFTTDADMVFTPNTFPFLCSWLESNPGNGVVLQCRDLPSDYSHDSVRRDGFDWGTFERTAKLRPRWGMGGLFGLDRRLIDAVGGYDERMHTYGGEDLDFAQRVRRSGVPITWIDDLNVRMYHLWHPSTHAAVKKQNGGSQAVAHNQKILREDKSWVRNVTGGFTRTDNDAVVSFLTVAHHDDDVSEVQEAIESVLAQTVDRVESIVVYPAGSDHLVSLLGHDNRIKSVEVDAESTSGDFYAAGIQAASGQWTAFQPVGGVSITDRAEVLLNHIRGGQAGAWSAVGVIDADEKQGQRIMPCNPTEATSRSWNNGLAASSLFLRTDVLRRLVEPVNGRVSLKRVGRLIAGADLQLMQAQRALVGVWAKDIDETEAAQIAAYEANSGMWMAWAGRHHREDESFSLPPKDLLALAPSNRVIQTGVLSVPAGLDALEVAASMDAATRVWTETRYGSNDITSTIRMTGMTRRDLGIAKRFDPSFASQTYWCDQESRDTVSRLDPTTEIVGSILEDLVRQQCADRAIVAVSTDIAGFFNIDDLLDSAAWISHIVTERIDVHVLVQPMRSAGDVNPELWAALIDRRREPSSSLYMVHQYGLSGKLGLLTTEVASLGSRQKVHAK